MNLHNGAPVFYFDSYPGGVIAHEAAVSDDGTGRVHHLKGGEPFRGFAAENSSGPSASIMVEGIASLNVEGVQKGDIGKRVFATGHFSFTIDPKGKKASEIGYIIAAGDYGKARVRFQAAKIL